MEKIHFTSMNPLNETELDQLRVKERVDVEYQLMPWRGAWNELLRVALYNQGPDISEIGSTWLGSLSEMNALMPISGKIFTLQELQNLFYPSVYQSVLGKDEKTLLGVPWLTDTRVIYYRRSMLEKAGIDEKKAFADSNAFFETLEKLQQAGFKSPLSMPINGINTIYSSASWIWETGGDIRNEKGTLVLSEPKAQAGLFNYFSLHPFLAPQLHEDISLDPDSLFHKGEVAVLISGPWLFRWAEQNENYFDDLGIAKVPGVPFIGGTHLVVWAHSLLLESTLHKFFRFATSIETQSHFIQKTNLLPARVEVLATEPFIDNPFYKVFAESLNKGRVFKVFYRSAAVEQRLMILFTSLWADLAKNPDLPLKEELYKRTEVVIDRLNRTILTSI